MQSFPEPVPPARTDTITAIRRGLRNRCPECGQGRMFGRFLKVADACESCGTELHHHRADDLPPYIVIFIVGHLVGYGILMTETKLEVPCGFISPSGLPLRSCYVFCLMQPIKGAVVGLQYALGMHGFGAARARRAKIGTGEIDIDGDSGTDGSPRLRGA